MNSTPANKKQFFLGLCSLICGFIFYCVCRPNMSTYFQQKFPNIDIFMGNYPNLLGKYGGFLPEFLHPFGFSLIGMGLISRTRKSRVLVCIIFLLMNIIFELGQNYGTYLANFIPDIFNKFYILENTKNFFVFGTFSVFDLMAIFLGSIMAIVIAEILSQKGGSTDEKVVGIS